MKTLPASVVLLLASPTRPLDVGRRDFLTTISAATQTRQTWTPTALEKLSLANAAQLDQLPFARYPDPILRLEARPVRRFDAALAKTVALLRAAARRCARASRARARRSDARSHRTDASKSVPTYGAEDAFFIGATARSGRGAYAARALAAPGGRPGPWRPSVGWARRHPGG